MKHVTTDFHNQGEEKNEVFVYLSSEVYVYPSSEVVKNVAPLNPAHIGLQQDLLKLETLPPAITSSVNLATSARFAEVIESESTKYPRTWGKWKRNIKILKHDSSRGSKRGCGCGLWLWSDDKTPGKTVSSDI